MKLIVTAGLAVLCTTAGAIACPWAGGTYSGKELGFSTEFAVNDACTEIEMKTTGSSGFQNDDVPETFPLAADGDTWVADINGLGATLRPDGKDVSFQGNGISRILHTKKLN